MTCVGRRIVWVPLITQRWVLEAIAEENRRELKRIAEQRRGCR